jgi:hypothetical protein
MTKRKRKTPKNDYPRPWEDLISTARWLRYREQIMSRYCAGSRPKEWWVYEKGREKPEREDEAAALLEMAELSDAELAELMPHWREKYEEANETGFAYCTGSKAGETFANWIEGAAARKAYCRWVGIPPEIVKKWDAERKRGRSAN